MFPIFTSITEENSFWGPISFCNPKQEPKKTKKNNTTNAIKKNNKKLFVLFFSLVAYKTKAYLKFWPKNNITSLIVGRVKKASDTREASTYLAHATKYCPRDQSQSQSPDFDAIGHYF